MKRSQRRNRKETMEAPTAVTDKFPPEIYGDNLLKTLKKYIFKTTNL